MPNLTHDTIAFEEARTLAGLFAARCRRSPEGEAYRQFDASRQAWSGVTWAEMEQQVARWRTALAGEQLPPGERVAVLLKNSIEWVCFDQAALSLGLVVVPLYPTDNAENLAYILGDCGARVLLLSDAYRWASLAPLKAQFPHLQRVVCTAPSPGLPHGGLAMDLQDWLARSAGPVALKESYYVEVST